MLCNTDGMYQNKVLRCPVKENLTQSEALVIDNVRIWLQDKVTLWCSVISGALHCHFILLHRVGDKVKELFISIINSISMRNVRRVPDKSIHTVSLEKY